MPPTHALYDVDPFALTICKKGANRQRIFLKKSADEDEPTITLPAEHIIFKARDWSAFYCVVAEPGAEEDGGIGAESIVDVWKSDDEIRKAAHRFLKNQPYVNAMHDALAAEGCHVVESAVAIADFDVIDPTATPRTIKKGSWYVAIEPSDEFAAKVESGEITGVSLEGAGLREELAKAAASYKGADKCPSCGGKVAKDQAKCPNCGAKSPLHKTHADEAGKASGPLKHLIAYYKKKPHPFRACVKDNRKRFGPRTEAICAGLKDVSLGTHKWRKGGGVKKASDDELESQLAAKWAKRGLTDDDATMALEALEEQADAAVQKSLVQRMAVKLGVIAKDDCGGGCGDCEDCVERELDDELRKQAMPTFDALLAEREMSREMPTLTSVLDEVIWRAFHPPEDVQGDPRTVISDSLDQMKSHLLALLDRTLSDLAADDKPDVKKALGIDPDTLPSGVGTLGDNDEEDDVIDEERFAKLEKAAEENGKATEKLIDLVEKLTTRERSDDDKPDAASVKKAMEDLTTTVTDSIAKIAADVEAIATGESVQHDEDETTPVKKSDRPLAGLLA